MTGSTRGTAEKLRAFDQTDWVHLVSWSRKRINAGHVSRYDGEDIAAETLLKLLQNPSPAEDNHLNYVYGVARFTAYEHYRRHDAACRSTAKDVSLHQGDGVAHTASSANDPARQVEDEDWMEFLASRLSDREREIVELLKLGVTKTEIAAELGIHDRSVRKALARIRAKWSRYLNI